MDKFPEAFERFEEVVDVDNIHSFQELIGSFASWAGKTWKGTRKQTEALRVEARKRGIRWEIPRYIGYVPRHYGRGSAQGTVARAVPSSFRRESVTVRGRSQVVYRDVKSGRFVRKP